MRMEKYENLTSVIADNLTYYRKKSKLTQSELAEKLNYSDKSISKWERAEGVPDIYILVQLADLYGLTVNDFLTTKKKEKIANIYFSKILITLMSIALVWFIATLVFISLRIFASSTNENFKHWLIFIYALPISFILLIIFNDVFFKRAYNIIAVSGLCWTIALSLFLSLSFLENISLIFIVAIPFQVMIILFYIFLLKRKNK